MALPGIRDSSSIRFRLLSTAGPQRLGLLADFSPIILFIRCFKRSDLKGRGGAVGDAGGGSMSIDVAGAAGDIGMYPGNLDFSFAGSIII